MRGLKRLLGRKPAKHYRALNDLDRSLERACPEICTADTFYIEAGANDGLNQSNTYFLEEKYGARGLLIEAAPSSFERLLANRSARNIFECCALIPRDYPDQFVEMVFSNLMTTVAVDGQSDLPVPSDEHAKIGLQFLSKHLRNYRFGAIAATLQSLLTKHAIKKVDLFSLDVEGSELSVLKGVDFEVVDIERLLIECRDIDRMVAFLAQHGYALKHQLSKHDYLFLKQS